MKRFIRTISLIVSLSLLITALGACTPKTTPSGSTSGTSQPKDIETVNLFNSVGAYLAVLEKLVKEYNEGEGLTDGVKIEMTTNIDNYTEVLEAAVKAGNAPDMYTCNPNHMLNGWVKALDDIAGLEDLMTRFKPLLRVGVTTFGGKTYALPLECVPIKLAYNIDLFKEAGIVDSNGAAVPPKTLAEQVEDAKKITAIGDGKAYGYGFTYAFVVGFRRLAMKAVMSSVGHGWFDNNTGKYDFGAFKPEFEALAQMYKDGSVFPGPESIQIDPIRSQFADGNIGMFVAPSYDIGVYNDQFPAKCDWGVADNPTFTAGPAKYKGVFLSRINVSISKEVSDKRLPAVVEAFKMMHSEETYAYLYANGGVILQEKDIMEKTPLVVEKKNFKVMSDLTNYISMPTFPDASVLLEGDKYETVLSRVMTGQITADEAIADLDARYNAGYQKGIADGKIDKTLYEYKFDMTVD